MEALPYASWFKDSEGRYTQVSGSMLRFIEKERPEVIGKRSSEIVDGERFKQPDEREQDVYESKKLEESTYSRGDRIYKTINFPVLDSRGNISGTGGYQEDITNLTRSLQALHMERETLETLLENMPFYIFFTDKNLRYIRVNTRMAKLLRAESPKAVVGKCNMDFFSRRLARKMEEEDRLILESGEPINNRILYFEDEGVDGFWIEINKIPIKDERGVITMIMGIFKDVSDLKEIENQLKEARDRAEESDRLKTSFLANMSHEIRTPMNGILGFANLLRDPDLSEEQRDLYLKHIDLTSNQLLHIIDDIVDISKIESGQLKISNKPVRINVILDEIYYSFFHRIRGDAPGQKKVAFNLKKGESSSDFTIVTDDLRLKQIFNNLIGNAIKFTHEGHITFGYSIKHSRYIEFHVSDSGVGIPENQLDLIFDRFGQVSPAQSYQPKGTGLGLPISKNLVNLMGGEMWVESVQGKGSTFYFTLPLVVEKPVETMRDLISNKTYYWNGRKILVAEDEELNWHFIREMLRKTGAEVLRAKDGKEAVALAREATPDIILMDIKMPEMDGIDATREIRDFNRGVPVIAQTAFVMAEEQEACLKAGCNYFVTKPIDRTVIMEIIDGYFRRTSWTGGL